MSKRMCISHQQTHAEFPDRLIPQLQAFNMGKKVFLICGLISDNADFRFTARHIADCAHGVGLLKADLQVDVSRQLF